MADLMCETKRCVRCREDKPLNAFGHHAKTRDRLQSWCKTCTRDRTRELRAEDPRVASRDTRQARAHRAAQRELRERHRAEFDAIYTAELAARGLS